MKPVPFTYLRATSVAQACAWLAEDPESRIIAGGQTLMPMLAMRLARPTRVIDISRIPGLSGISIEHDAVVIGATTPQFEAEDSAVIAQEVPLLARAMPWVGHAPTRRRGTVGGSVANADPSAEIPLVAVTLGAELMITDTAGERHVPVEGFFLAPMMTAMPEGGLLTAIRFPRRANGTGMGTGFCEMSNRRSDYALAAAAVELTFDAAGRCSTLAIGIGGAAEIPVRLDLSALLGRPLDKAELEQALVRAIAPLPLLSDPAVSAAYRARIAVTLALRAVAQAEGDARGDTSASLERSAA